MKTKEELPDRPVATTVALIGNKWKLPIMRNLLVRRGGLTNYIKVLTALAGRFRPKACARYL